MSDEVHGIATHPLRSELLLSSYSGNIYLWDYNSKVSSLRSQCTH